jgi:hypothetical protein
MHAQTMNYRPTVAHTFKPPARTAIIDEPPADGPQLSTKKFVEILEGGEYVKGTSIAIFTNDYLFSPDSKLSKIGDRNWFHCSLQLGKLELFIASNSGDVIKIPFVNTDPENSKNDANAFTIPVIKLLEVDEYNRPGFSIEFRGKLLICSKLPDTAEKIINIYDVKKRVEDLFTLISQTLQQSSNYYRLKTNLQQICEVLDILENKFHFTLQEESSSNELIENHFEFQEFHFLEISNQFLLLQTALENIHKEIFQGGKYQELSPYLRQLFTQWKVIECLGQILLAFQLFRLISIKSNSTSNTSINMATTTSHHATSTTPSSSSYPWMISLLQIIISFSSGNQTGKQQILLLLPNIVPILCTCMKLLPLQVTAPPNHNDNHNDNHDHHYLEIHQLSLRLILSLSQKSNSIYCIYA